MMEPKGRPHPSGRPVARKRWGVETQTRRPHDGPLSPGLQRGGFTHAVGFTARLAADDYDDE